MNERYYSIDFMKFFAIFAVVCIHTRPFENTYLGEFNGYNITLFINTISRFAVPYFFMTAGFLFGKKMVESNNKRNDFKVYLYKIIKIYICWTAFYVIYILGKDTLMSFLGSGGQDLPLTGFKLSAVLRLFGSLLYYGYPGTHMWYLIALIWCVVIMFVFYSKGTIKVLVFISLGLTLIGLFGDSYKGILKIPLMTRDALFFGMFYCALGFYIASNENSFLKRLIKKPRVLLFIVFTFSILQLFERAILIAFFHGELGDNFFISTMPMTVALFLYVLSKKDMGKNSYITKIGRNTLGIYVIHLFFLDMTKFIAIILLDININTVGFQIIFTPIVFLMSYFGYQVVQFIHSYIKMEGQKCIVGTAEQFKN